MPTRETDSAVALLQLAIAAVLSAPFYPLMGSAAFLMGYMRPVRFWERKYQTHRLYDSDVRLADANEYNGGKRWAIISASAAGMGA